MIESLEQLEACLGATPPAVGQKVISELDSNAERWLTASPLIFVGLERPEGMALTIAGGELGFARARDAKTLRLPIESIDDATLAAAGRGVGLLSLVPGLGETLRVNGRISAMTGDAIEIEVGEVYLHCAKSLMRSAFWTAPARGEVPVDPQTFLHEARFMAVATSDGQGHADVSPKGDPAGVLLRSRGSAVSYAERPGNRRKDSLKNLLVQPRLAAVALIPGATRVAVISGAAQMDASADACAPFEVSGKTPRLVTTLADARVVVRESAALARAGWPLRATEHGIDPVAVFTEHIKRNKQTGLKAALLRRVLTKKLMGAGLSRDYKKNLY